ncbi:MAG TPA: UDP-2,3-diacylglucosamine diphosphatase [Thermodesulfobacteriota bacterium]|nr:UDP-2,3-diacylglucosamine diphosphatase [Thermodesulfobacteriota bacterium]
MARSEKDWIFVSDAHFDGRDPESIGAFLKFLDSEKEEVTHLVILGDLFEFFFGFKNFSSKEKLSAFVDYLPVFQKLQSLHQEGVRIKYFEGNHDFFLHSFFSKQFGMEVEVYPDGSEERLGGKRTYIAHGDLSNPRQWTYRIFRRILKNPWTYGLVHFAGPRVSRRVAMKLSNMSYQKYHNDVPTSPPPAFKAFAHQKFLEGFEIVILGHSHFPEEVEERIDGRRCLYYNVGDWMVHRSFLRFTPPDYFELTRYMER